MPLLVDAMLGNKESGARSWCSRKSQKEPTSLQHFASDVDGSSVKIRFKVPASLSRTRRACMPHHVRTVLVFSLDDQTIRTQNGGRVSR